MWNRNGGRGGIASSDEELKAGRRYHEEKRR